MSAEWPHNVDNKPKTDKIMERKDLQNDELKRYRDFNILMAKQTYRRGENICLIRCADRNSELLSYVDALLRHRDDWNEEDGFKYDPLDGEQKGFVPTFYIDYTARRVCLRSSKPVTSHPVMLPVVLSTPERAEAFGEEYIELFNHVMLNGYDDRRADEGEAVK
ncbi:MAG: hypothetical protein LUC44_06085 [Prevotellaceae bacterium]|nr:hypothetical protein [Prevotellaceae bacterium]